MNFKTTLIIVILLIGVGGAYYLFFQKSPDDPSTDEKPTISQVYGVTSDTVQQVEISFADTAYQNLKLEKEDAENWQLTEPIQVDADSEKVKQVLDDILNKRIKQTLEVPALAAYGLDAPSITLSLWANGTTPAATFLIGKKAINFSVYAKEKSEAHIFLIESSALDDLTKSTTDLRDRSMIKFNTETVSGIQLQQRDTESTIHCEKRDNTWHVVHPIEAKADAEEIETLLSELRALKVSTFEADGADANNPERMEKYGLDTPRIQARITDTHNTYALNIGAAVPSDNRTQEQVYVKVSIYQDAIWDTLSDPPIPISRIRVSIHPDAIYTVSEDVYNLLNKSVFDLRDKRVIDFQRIDTIRFEIKEDKETVVGTRNYDDTWELQTPTAKIKADADAVSDLIFGVDSLEAAAFVEGPIKNLAAYGLAPPAIEVAFTQRGEEKPAVLLIGNRTQDGTVYVKSEQSEQVVRVKPALIDNIALGAAWLRDKQVLDFHIDDAVRLTFAASGEEPITCQRLGTNWRITAPVREDANNVEVNAIIYELDDLMAEAFVGSEPTTAGFDKPNVQLTVELRNQKMYTLQIGTVDAFGRFYARLQHEPELIFLLNAELVPKLKTTLALLRTSEQGAP